LRPTFRRDKVSLAGRWRYRQPLELPTQGRRLQRFAPSSSCPACSSRCVTAAIAGLSRCLDGI
jgi:hypothetical protein